MTAHDTSQVFNEHRNLLFSVAYRVLGTAVDAEDAVQEAWVKWSAADRSAVADPKAYLARIVSTVAIDKLRSAKARRETYVGPWLPEPILTSTDTADDVAAESVSTALLMVLETLSPLERAVFVLKEVFDFGYGDIASAVGRSEDTVRQAAHRARKHVRDRRPRFHADRARLRDVTERFFAAASGGDINVLMQLLAPDVTLWTDGGGKVRQAIRPITGADRVSAWLAGVADRPYEGVHLADMTAELAELNGAPGVVFSHAGGVLGTVAVDMDARGRIVAIYNVVNPDKLRSVTARTVHRL